MLRRAHKNGRGCRPHHPPAERLASRPTRLPELYAGRFLRSRPGTDNTYHRSLDAYHFSTLGELGRFGWVIHEAETRFPAADSLMNLQCYGYQSPTLSVCP